MKTFNLFWAMLLLATTAFFTACDDSDNNDTHATDPDKNEEIIQNVHYDIWVSLDETSGMGKGGTSLVQSLNSLEEDKTIDFINKGCDVTASIDEETIIKDKYYYQAAPCKKPCFGKYQIVNNELRTIQERPFKTNTYKDRRYTHAWIDDNTLVIIAANGKADEIIWTKLNAATMEIIAEGNLGLAEKNGFTKFSTSGLARYRKSDNTIIYAFQDKNDKKAFYVAFIDATNMTVKNYVKEDHAEQMAGTAYGELLQHKMFLDDNDNLYIACNSRIPNSEKSTCQYGCLLRINKNQYDFDKNYQGFKYQQGKLVTVDYLGNNKALLYIQDPKHTGISSDNAIYEGWGDKYNCYYAVLDLTTDDKKELTYNGNLLPYSSGTFSQRSFILNGKAYIGVNPEKSAPVVYVYDIKKDQVSKGITIQGGYNFNRIGYIHD